MYVQINTVDKQPKALANGFKINGYAWFMQSSKLTLCECKN